MPSSLILRLEYKMSPISSYLILEPQLSSTIWGVPETLDREVLRDVDHCVSRSLEDTFCFLTHNDVN